MLEMLELLERNNACLKALIHSDTHPMQALIKSVILANDKIIQQIEDDLTDMAVDSVIDDRMANMNRGY